MDSFSVLPSFAALIGDLVGFFSLFSSNDDNTATPWVASFDYKR